MRNDLRLKVVGASEHNLKKVTLTIPRNSLTVVTGVSGSGKSSLAFDVIYREAESRYLGSFSSIARQFMGKMHQPDVERVDGLSPAVALDQKSVVSSPRSTVGTLTGIYDLLRLIFARTGTISPGTGPFPVSRALFSFNSAEGACPACKGLGVEDFLDPGLIVADENRSLRQGALVITAPNGYIIYSQVTLEVLDQVCREEGFHIDIPWKDLTPEQKNIIWYGSDKIEIPFGKHPLESRMKWSGITAKPREMGYYKGILPIMEDILRRDRNRNILRFVRSIPCRKCGGRRLNEKALSVKIGGSTIADLSDLELDELPVALMALPFKGSDKAIARPAIEQVARQSAMLSRLGLGYLTASRESTTLSGGESQRLRLATLASMTLSNLVFVLDEPTAGLHPHDTAHLVGILKEIRDRGNTVIVVEHDETVMRSADCIVDIGPGPGKEGGELLFCGAPREIALLPPETIRQSPTLAMLSGMDPYRGEQDNHPVLNGNFPEKHLVISGARVNNLRNVDVAFRLHALNVVTGVSGAGKSSLTEQVLARFMEAHLQGKSVAEHFFTAVSGFESLGKLVVIDQAPIGRTPRSNPATYTGVFDLIRDLFARQPEAIRLGYDKSRFSFNTEGGRCESCQGAGYRQIGMHFMGNVEVPCEACEGKRFDETTLSIQWNGYSVSDILEMTVDDALPAFHGYPAILQYLETLSSLGLGYLSLGQRSSTLSGGEAQRIKLATELARQQALHTLYIMDEPTTGLHASDVQHLVRAVESLVNKGHTVVMMEHHPMMILRAAHVIDLGPGSGRKGGTVVVSGTVQEVLQCNESLTGKALRECFRMEDASDDKQIVCTEIRDTEARLPGPLTADCESILLKGVSTHNLKNIDIELPHGKITVVTGISGSGKSSLVFDTLYATAQNRFMEGFSAWVRSRAGMQDEGSFDTVSGLTPALALRQRTGQANPRSTVGTLTGIYDMCRLLWARCATNDADPTAPRPLSGYFSFNLHHGACPACKGLGTVTVCDREKLIRQPALSILDGAIEGTRTGRFYGDPFGQYTATIRAVGDLFGIDYSVPWNQLTDVARQFVLDGTGEQEYEVNWQYRRGKREGEHRFNGKWAGLRALIEAEYDRKHADHRGEEMMEVMAATICETCRGSRLQPEALDWRISGMDIAAFVSLQADEAIAFLEQLPESLPEAILKEAAGMLAGEMITRYRILKSMGLLYLTAGRSLLSLSDGEERRVRLASMLTSGLTGLTYVFDEPSTGLHPRDTKNLMVLIRSLCEAGNTVVMVEHDPEVIRSADHVIDLGPGAGIGGGQIVACGTPEMIMCEPGSVTGKYLQMNLPVKRVHSRQDRGGLRLTKVFMHNLKGFDLTLPGNGLIVVTGVSGSGKSTLVFDVIYRSWLESRATGCEAISGFENYRQVVAGGGAGSAGTGSSVVATYCGIFDQVRRMMASTPEAISAGFGKNHFSFLNREGQCAACEGKGEITISMDFLPDLVTVCEHCRGRRYREEVLAVGYMGKNISSILEMPVTEAALFFAGDKKIAPVLRLLCDIGLGYLPLGQETCTLSGGERQRLDLAVDLLTPASGPTLWLFDEPTAGLHPADTGMLLTLFQKLVDRGDTLIVTEHDPMVTGAAGFMVELGPEGGNGGGYLLAAMAG